MDGWVLVVLGLTFVLVLMIAAVRWVEDFRKSRRILTEGTVTSRTRETKTESYPASFSPYSPGGTTTSVEVTLDFEFYVDGKRWTARKTMGEGWPTNSKLAEKKEGDRIRVYYLPENPGRDQMLEA